MKKFITTALVIAPSLAFAQTFSWVTNFLTSVKSLIRLALPIVVGLALLGFFWGLARFVFRSGDEEARKEARGMMIWSIVALTVMVSVWGLVNILAQNFGVTSNGNITVPTVPGL